MLLENFISPKLSCTRIRSSNVFCLQTRLTLQRTGCHSSSTGTWPSSRRGSSTGTWPSSRRGSSLQCQADTGRFIHNNIYCSNMSFLYTNKYWLLCSLFLDEFLTKISKSFHSFPAWKNFPLKKCLMCFISSQTCL